jgi:putative redox protein
VTVRGKLTAKQRQVLENGVETCPVGNTLRRSLNLIEIVEFAE